jgi:3-oxoacyl-[acyl-carrier-protein] synthase II
MNSERETRRQVVITGLGILSPIGIGVEAFWESLAAGRSGIAELGLMSYSAAPGNVAAEVNEFTEKSARKQYLQSQRKSIKVMCREIQLGVASAGLAMEHAGLSGSEIDRDRFGVDFGANLMLSPPEVLRDPCWACADENGGGHEFHYERWGEQGLSSMEPLWLLKYLPNMPACHIGIFADARGPSNSITLAEASGNLALGEASRIIHREWADVMIAGTTGTRVHPVKTIQAALWDTLAEGEAAPETWCRPFDLKRTGQVLGEGACSFILEETEHARQRGAAVLGRVLGSGSSCVADRDGKPRFREALATAMRSALRDADLAPDEIGHVNAHGLSTTQLDREEAAAIQDVFGSYTEKLPVTAIKSYLGNAGSGCGSLELAASIVGLLHGVVPHTLNYETPDPACPLNVVRGEPRSVTNKRLININVTRMGQASALIAEAV